MVEGIRPFRDDPKQHELKVAGAHLMDALLDGTKTFEVRTNDRDFRAGDTLWLRELAPHGHGFTGRHLRKRVLYLFGPDDDLCGFLLAENVVVMALGAMHTYRSEPA